MPDAPALPCRAPGCPALVPGGGHCDGHRALRDARPAASRRGYDAAWTKLSRWYRSLHPLCERCGEPATEVHHRIPVRVAPERRLDVENLEAVCRECHAAATVEELERWPIRYGVDDRVDLQLDDDRVPGLA